MLEIIQVALAVLDDLMKNNIKTYVHCKNGHGRTTTLLAAYYMRKNRVPADEALAIVKEKRPSGHLNEIQKQFLIELENYYEIRF